MNVAANLAAQYRAHRADRIAANHAARAAARLVATSHHADRAGHVPEYGTIVDRRYLDELEGAVAEWQQAHAATGRYTLDLGRVVLSSTSQVAGAPIVDQAAVTVTRAHPGLDVAPLVESEGLSGWAIRAPGHSWALVVAVRGYRHRPPRRRPAANKHLIAGAGEATTPRPA